MNSPSTFFFVAAVALACASATAQTSTDEVHAMASQSIARQLLESLDSPPIPERVAPGDYRAQVHQEVRLQQWQAEQSAVRAYHAGVRSQPLAVNSTDTARAEAQRLHLEQRLAERDSASQATAWAR